MPMNQEIYHTMACGSTNETKTVHNRSCLCIQQSKSSRVHVSCHTMGIETETKTENCKKNEQHVCVSARVTAVLCSSKATDKPLFALVLQI